MSGGEGDHVRTGGGSDDVHRPLSPTTSTAIAPTGASQTALPPLRQVMRAASKEAFAHPAEHHFSRLLSYYRIHWVYEPTTFALAWAPDGRPSQMFTPDFYLPEHRLYIELTTMRQRLVTRKNRKLRRLRELYPNVQIKLLYRRDYLRLLAAYPCPERPSGDCQLGPVVFSETEIQTRVHELAAAIASDFRVTSSPVAQPPLLVIGVGRGSQRFLDALTAALASHHLAIETDHVDLTRYRTIGGAPLVRVRRGPQLDLTGRCVLLVEDIVSTGLSLGYLAAWLRRRHVAGLEICTMLDRRSTRLVDIPIRYAAFDAPTDLLVGFGLNLHRKFRDLPFIAAVETSQS